MKGAFKVSRRNFIKLATQGLLGISGLLGLGALARFFSYEPEPEVPTMFDLGNAANFPVGSITIRTEIPAVVYNRAGEFIAYSLICPHLGCSTESKDEGFVCPCHGSRFDEDGKVIEGPAQKSLRGMRVEILEDQTLRLHVSS